MRVADLFSFSVIILGCLMDGAFLAVYAVSRLVVCTMLVILLHIAYYLINEDC